MQRRFLGYGVIGNTTDSGPVFPGSSPGTPTKKMRRLTFEKRLPHFLLYKCTSGNPFPASAHRRKAYMATKTRDIRSYEGCPLSL